MAKKGFNPDWLKGLKFSGATKATVEKDGHKKVQYIPFVRDLTEAEIFDWKDKGETVVIVTADGKKHTVKK